MTGRHFDSNQAERRAQLQATTFTAYSAEAEESQGAESIRRYPLEAILNESLNCPTVDLRKL